MNTAEALGRADLLEDARFLTGPQLVENVRDLYAELGQDVRKLTTAAFLALSTAAGVPFAKVNSVEDFLEDPHVKASQAYVEFEDPELGGIRHLNYPAVFGRTPVDVARRAPRLGEHTDELPAMIAKPTPGGPA